MTVYRYFSKIAWKHKWVILVYICIFFIISIINSIGTNERERIFTETRLDIGIIDKENSELSRGLRKYIESRNNIVDTKEDEDFIKEQIFLQIADGVIIIPEGFDDKVKNREEAVIIYTDERKPQSIQIHNQVNKYLSFANITYKDGEFMLEDVDSALSETVNVNLIAKDKGSANDRIIEWFRYYFNFTGYVTMAVYISAIGLVMSDFTDKNIEMRRRISAKGFLQFNREIYLGQLTVASICTLIFVLGSIVLMGRYVRKVQFIKYIVNLLVFSLSVLCLTFLINNITRNKYAINAISTVLSLGTSFISGVMVPQEILGEKVLMIAKFFPTYYFVKANNKVISSLLDIKGELFMQVLFAVAFLLIGLIFSKRAQRA